MACRIPRDPVRPALSETVRVDVDIDTKLALAEAARRAGKPVAGLVREAIVNVVARDRRGAR